MQSMEAQCLGHPEYGEKLGVEIVGAQSTKVESMKSQSMGTLSLRKV